MGPAKGDPRMDALPVKTAALLRKAGFEVVLPGDNGSLCCGQPFESKGLPEQANAKRREVEQALLKASRNGQDPMYSIPRPAPCGSRKIRHKPRSSCTTSPVPPRRGAGAVDDPKRSETVAIHPTCNNINMGLQAKLKTIAEACVEKVIVPDRVFPAGLGRGQRVPSPGIECQRLGDLRAALPEDCTSGYSTSRTCEIGLSCTVDVSTAPSSYLVDRCSQPNTG